MSVAETLGYPNLTIKKIPKAVLACCEWEHDDYSLADRESAEAAEEGQELLI